MMKILKNTVILIGLVFVMHCEKAAVKPQNLISWFEIPAKDFDRAVKFYGAVMNIPIDRKEIQGTEMGFFKTERDSISGAVVAGPEYEPGTRGPLLYLNGGSDLLAVLGRVEQHGGKVIVAKTKISDEFGYFALFMDTEGNKVALHSPK